MAKMVMHDVMEVVKWASKLVEQTKEKEMVWPASVKLKSGAGQGLISSLPRAQAWASDSKWLIEQCAIKWIEAKGAWLKKEREGENSNFWHSRSECSRTFKRMFICLLV